MAMDLDGGIPLVRMHVTCTPGVGGDEVLLLPDEDLHPIL